MASLNSVQTERRLTLPRIDLRMAVGFALVLVSVLGGLLLWQRAQTTTPVVVATRDIARGEVIAREAVGLSEARLEGSLALLALGEGSLEWVVGRSSEGPIPAGAMILRPTLGTGPVITPDEAAVTFPVEADEVYRLRRGDEVAVVATSTLDARQLVTELLLDRAVVFAVGAETERLSLGGDGESAGGGSLTSVTLLIPRAKSERVSQAIVSGQLTLLLLAPVSTPVSTPASAPTPEPGEPGR